MNKYILSLLAAASLLACGNPTKKNQAAPAASPEQTATVYFTPEITPESLVAVYEALGREASGKVAIKISTGEMGGENYLQPALIAPLVQKVQGTLVECNTAYGGSRATTAVHKETIRAHGFYDIAPVDILDEEGEIKIPVSDDKWIQYDIVGDHIQQYDFMINLAHFKGHAMGGFGGVLKNASIGVASPNGKVYIHSAGAHQQASEDGNLHAPEGWYESPEKNTPFIEAMAAAAQAVHNYFGGGEHILYIAIMNNISIDCDCDAHPHDPTLQDIGIAASLDPVALDRFCLDRVMDIPVDENNDNRALVERIAQRHGTRIVSRGEEIGLGTTHYTVVNL